MIADFEFFLDEVNPRYYDSEAYLNSKSFGKFVHSQSSVHVTRLSASSFKAFVVTKAGVAYSVQVTIEGDSFTVIHSKYSSTFKEEPNLRKFISDYYKPSEIKRNIVVTTPTGKVLVELSSEKFVEHYRGYLSGKSRSIVKVTTERKINQTSYDTKTEVIPQDKFAGDSMAVKNVIGHLILAYLTKHPARQAFTNPMY